MRTLRWRTCDLGHEECKRDGDCDDEPRLGAQTERHVDGRVVMIMMDAAGGDAVDVEGDRLLSV